MSSVSETVRALLARHNVDVDPAAESIEPPFDPIAYRVDNYRRILDREIPATFKSAGVDAAVEQWVRLHIADPVAAPWLLLCGNTGVGKTHQAYGALRELVMASAQANRRCRWQFVTHPDLNEQRRPKPDDSHTWALERYMDADLLVVDDLGAGKQNEWTGDGITRLVDHRWAHRLPTIYTTNLDPDELEAAVGPRVLSRLADATRVDLVGPDRRWDRSGQ